MELEITGNNSYFLGYFYRLQIPKCQYNCDCRSIQMSCWEANESYLWKFLLESEIIYFVYHLFVRCVLRKHSGFNTFSLKLMTFKLFIWNWTFKEYFFFEILSLNVSIWLKTYTKCNLMCKYLESRRLWTTTTSCPLSKQVNSSGEFNNAPWLCSDLWALSHPAFWRPCFLTNYR